MLRNFLNLIVEDVLKKRGRGDGKLPLMVVQCGSTAKTLSARKRQTSKSSINCLRGIAKLSTVGDSEQNGIRQRKENSNPAGGHRLFSVILDRLEEGEELMALTAPNVDLGEQLKEGNPNTTTSYAPYYTH